MKKLVSLALSASLIALAPGLSFYEASAQVFTGARAPVAPAGAVAVPGLALPNVLPALDFGARSGLDLNLDLDLSLDDGTLALSGTPELAVDDALAVEKDLAAAQKDVSVTLQSVGEVAKAPAAAAHTAGVELETILTRERRAGFEAAVDASLPAAALSATRMARKKPARTEFGNASLVPLALSTLREAFDASSMWGATEFRGKDGETVELRHAHVSTTGEPRADRVIIHTGWQWGTSDSWSEKFVTLIAGRNPKLLITSDIEDVPFEKGDRINRETVVDNARLTVSADKVVIEILDADRALTLTLARDAKGGLTWTENYEQGDIVFKAGPKPALSANRMSEEDGSETPAPRRGQLGGKIMAGLVSLALPLYFTKDLYLGLYQAFLSDGAFALLAGFPVVTILLLNVGLAAMPFLLHKRSRVLPTVIAFLMLAAGGALTATGTSMLFGGTTMLAGWSLIRAFADAKKRESWARGFGATPFFGILATIVGAAALLTGMEGWVATSILVLAGLDQLWLMGVGLPKTWRLIPAALSTALIYAIALPLFQGGFGLVAAAPTFTALMLGSMWFMNKETPRFLRWVPGLLVLAHAPIAFYIGMAPWTAGATAIAGLALLRYLHRKEYSAPSEARIGLFGNPKSGGLVGPAGAALYAAALTTLGGAYIATNAVAMFAAPWAGWVAVAAVLATPVALIHLHPSFLNTALFSAMTYFKATEGYFRTAFSWATDTSLMKNLGAYTKDVTGGGQWWNWSWVWPLWLAVGAYGVGSFAFATALPAVAMGSAAYGVMSWLGFAPFAFTAAVATGVTYYGISQLVPALRAQAALVFGALSPYKPFYRVSYFLEKFIEHSTAEIEGSKKTTWDPWALKWLKPLLNGGLFSAGLGLALNAVFLQAWHMIITLTSPLGAARAIKAAFKDAKEVDPAQDPDRYLEVDQDLAKDL